MMAATRSVVILVAGLVLATAIPAEPDRASEATGKPWLGIVIGAAVEDGLAIEAVVPGGPAFRAGLREGDVLVSIDRVAVPDRARLQERVAGMSPGLPVELTLRRGPESFVRTVLPVDRANRSRRLIGTLGGTYLPEPAAAGNLGLVTASISPELRIHYGAPEDAGILVIRVEEEGAAARAGVRVGDILTGACGVVLGAPGDLANGLLTARPDTAYELNLIREGEPLRIEFQPPVRRPTRLVVPPKGPEEELERLRAEVEAMQERIRELERRLELEQQSR